MVCFVSMDTKVDDESRKFKELDLMQLFRRAASYCKAAQPPVIDWSGRWGDNSKGLFRTAKRIVKTAVELVLSSVGQSVSIIIGAEVPAMLSSTLRF